MASRLLHVVQLERGGLSAGWLQSAPFVAEGLDVVSVERLVDGPAAMAADRTHVIIELAALGLTGYALDD